ncbi:MAG TPA: hypothetical protein VHB97_17420 [Polyangia bacterium]|jgi:hypothetical protein|nr:hypothetical protein [Polyangia bacterium]
MLRSLVLASLSLSSVVWFGCSKDSNVVKPPVIVGDDMSDGTGGNGGSGGSGGGGGTAGADMTMVAADMGPALPDLSGLPAPDHDPTQHPAPPRLNAGSGGAVNHNSTISAPEIWTAVWAGDEATIGADAQKFTAWMLTSSYWTTSLAEYGVHAGVAKGVITIPGPPPATIDQVELDQLIDANMGMGGWPTANGNTIISVVTNPSTSVTAGGQPAGCVQFDGYHQLSSSGGVPYLINAYCKDASGNPDFANLTVTISHEAAEASSDWNLSVNAAYFPGTKTKIIGGGETGDLCIAMNASIKSPAGDTYLVQKIFSDAAAAAGNKPFCPDPSVATDPFWGAGLYSGGTNDAVISVTRTGGKGSATFKIEPFSYDPNFGAMSFYIVGSLLPAGVTLTPDIARRADPNNPGGVLGMRAYGLPGSTTMVTLNVDNTFPATSVGQVNPILIIAQTPDRAKLSIWWASFTVKN